MVLKDLEEVTDLEKDLFSDPWSLKSFQHEIINNRLAHYYIVEEQGKIIGYFGFIIVLDECQIYNIAVSKDYQKMGLGKDLIACLREKYQDYLYVIVVCEEKKNITFYEKLGFEVAEGATPLQILTL